MTIAAISAATTAADNAGKAGPLGLLIVVLLGVAIAFLGRSMLKHLKRVPDTFERKDTFEEKDDADHPNGADSAR